MISGNLPSKWFAASLFFEAVHSDGSYGPGVWEECIVLIKVDDSESARREAERIGVERQHTYVAQAKDVVTWQFRQVERVYQIESPHLANGVEVFSRFLRPAEATSLLTPFEDSP